MTAVIPFAFEEQLVRAIWRGHAPWFVGKDVCACLGLKNSSDAIGTLDDDEKGVATTDPLAPGGSQTVVVVSEPGVYRLVFRSRKPEAERFKRWLAHDVLPQLRRTGAYAAEGAQDAAEPQLDVTREPLMHRVHLVRSCHAIHGRAVAQIMWRKLGLPAVPPPPLTQIDEARQCLRHILDANLHMNGPIIRDVLEQALDDDLEAQALLLPCGIKALPDRDAFLVANDHPFLRQIFKGSPWMYARAHMRVLRRLPGVTAGGQYRWGAHVQARSSLLPAELLDER